MDSRFRGSDGNWDFLRIHQISNPKYQTNLNDRNSNIQTRSSWKVLVIEYLNLKFVCNLVLGICIF